jgi:hypothetical protein
MMLAQRRRGRGKDQKKSLRQDDRIRNGFEWIQPGED